MFILIPVQLPMEEYTSKMQLLLGQIEKTENEKRKDGKKKHRKTLGYREKKDGKKERRKTLGDIWNSLKVETKEKLTEKNDFKQLKT
jgi:hypothetical protein